MATGGSPAGVRLRRPVLDCQALDGFEVARVPGNQNPIALQYDSCYPQVICAQPSVSSAQFAESAGGILGEWEDVADA